MASNSEADARTRIVNHMNKGHKVELSRYLRHYAQLPSHRVTSPTMKEISLENMMIQSDDGVLHSIPLEPPMKSYAEARTRAVEMDLAAREGLGLGDVDIDAFAPPEGLGVFVFGAVLFYFFCYFALPWQVPGSALYTIWDRFFPGGAETHKWLVQKIFLPVIGIHTAEAVWLDRTRLVKYGVRRGSGVWWAWVGSCFIEGFTSFKRFDGLVEEKREAKTKSR